GCLTGSVVHPAAFTFKLPGNVTFEEGAMVEPFAVGMQGATRARIKPGDVAVVLGAGPIGIMVALAALAGGCSKVLVSDVHQPKLDIASRYPGIIAVNITKRDLLDAVKGETVAGAPTSCLTRAARRRRSRGRWPLPAPRARPCLWALPSSR